MLTKPAIFVLQMMGVGCIFVAFVRQIEGLYILGAVLILLGSWNIRKRLKQKNS